MDLSDWRREIDELDAEMLRLLKQRARIVAKIGAVKAATGAPVVDEERERQILRRVENDCAADVLSAESARCVFRCIIEESRRIQTEIAAERMETC